MPDPDQPTTESLDDLNLVNAGYVADLYERYRSCLLYTPSPRD